MQNKSQIIKYGSLIVCMIWLYNYGSKQQDDAAIAPPPAKPTYTAMIIHNEQADTSWGYVVFKNDRQVIRQLSIPVLPGNKPFVNRQQAQVLANLVTHKLNHAQQPAVSLSELDSLGIIPITHALQTK